MLFEVTNFKVQWSMYGEMWFHLFDWIVTLPFLKIYILTLINIKIKVLEEKTGVY